MTSDAPTNRGEARAEALETLAETGAFSEIEDPVAWQRELRADRPLWESNAEQVPEILERLSTYLHEIRTLGRPERIEEDLRDQRFLLHTLQITIQAAMDAASHLATRQLLGDPETSQDLFLLLGKRGWLPRSWRRVWLSSFNSGIGSCTSTEAEQPPTGCKAGAGCTALAFARAWFR